MKRKLSLILCMLIVFTSIFSINAFAQPDSTAAGSPTASADANGAVQADPNDPFPDIDSVLILDPRTGDVLFEKNADVMRYPASTTKILTALLALENCKLDEQVTVSHVAASVEGSRIYLMEGEILTVEQMLYALLVHSANDAAIALAEHVSGDVQSFAVLMNERAQELGMVNSHFVTPNGLHDDNHYVTPRDLSLVAIEAMKNETFRTIVSTYKYEIPPTNLKPEARILYNSNQLLHPSKYYEGIQGIKTGFTSIAQASLVAQAERNGMRIMAIIMHTDRWTLPDKMTAVLNYAYNNFAPVNIVPAGEVAKKAKIKKGSENKVALQLAEPVNITAPVQNGQAVYDSDAYSYKVKTSTLTAPVAAGAKGGTLTLYRDGQVISEYDLLVAKEVPLSAFNRFRLWYKEKVPGFFKVVIAVILIAVIAYASLIVLVKRKQKKQIKKRQELKAKRAARSAPDDTGKR